MGELRKGLTHEGKNEISRRMLMGAAMLASLGVLGVAAMPALITKSPSKSTYDSHPNLGMDPREKDGTTHKFGTTVSSQGNARKGGSGASSDTDDEKTPQQIRKLSARVPRANAMAEASASTIAKGTSTAVNNEMGKKAPEEDAQGGACGGVEDGQGKDGQGKDGQGKDGQGKDFTRSIQGDLAMATLIQKVAQLEIENEQRRDQAEGTTDDIKKIREPWWFELLAPKAQIEKLLDVTKNVFDAQFTGGTVVTKKIYRFSELILSFIERFGNSVEVISARENQENYVNDDLINSADIFDYLMKEMEDNEALEFILDHIVRIYDYWRQTGDYTTEEIAYSAFKLSGMLCDDIANNCADILGLSPRKRQELKNCLMRTLGRHFASVPQILWKD